MYIKNRLLIVILPAKYHKTIVLFELLYGQIVPCHLRVKTFICIINCILSNTVILLFSLLNYYFCHIFSILSALLDFIQLINSVTKITATNNIILKNVFISRKNVCRCWKRHVSQVSIIHWIMAKSSLDLQPHYQRTL